MRSPIALVIMIAVGLSLPASADWNPGSPAKYFQLPDLDTTGIDVNSTSPFIVADDFLCRETGPITDIHIWGSWRNDYVPLGSAGEVNFSLYILSDVPAETSPTGYSMPGEILWQHNFAPNQYAFRIYADGLEEGWLDPPEGYLFPGDHICYQYNFSLSEEDWFQQVGTTEEPVVYWLEVQAYPADPGAMFGWKTSLDHWNDDATYASGNEPNITERFELVYPPAHPLASQSMDMAFVIESDEAIEAYDFGDAPDPGYPTTAASDGARHVVVPGRTIGNNIDSEADGQPDPDALGDDITSGQPDDEDGVFFLTPFSPGDPVDFAVKTAWSGVLDIWFDWDGDGSWNEPSDYVFGGIPVSTGYTNFTANVPSSATVGTVSFARFRFSSAGTPLPTGAAADGEVEDHKFVIDEEWLAKWARYPDITEGGIDVECSNGYLLADDFLCEETGKITEIHVWGSWNNDALPYGDDPDAVSFTLSIHADVPDSVTGTYSMPGDVLWLHEFQPGDFVSQIWRDGIEEGWMTPPDALLFPADHVCWHYAFYIDQEDAFTQVGTEEEPVVYWLDVQAEPADQTTSFGWKTSYEHWNDDAVWGYGEEPYIGPWSELVYPAGPMAGESIDLSFAIFTEEDTGIGDAPTETSFRLRQNMPNPFNPSTLIAFDVPPGGGRVTIEVFDVAGRRVTTLVDGEQTAGRKAAVWNGTSSDGTPLASGVYFCRMRAPGFNDDRKLVLLR